jgi:hypothetical protein
MSVNGFAFAQQSVMPRMYNNYVKGMTGMAEIGMNLEYRVDFGTPAVADPDGILNDAADATTYNLADFRTVTGFDANGMLDATFGRNLTVVGSTTGTPTVTIYGFDYLGQPMIEVITGAAAVAAPGLKAFKWVRQIVISDQGSATWDIGFGDVLGLPYKSSAVLVEWADGVKTGSLGTFVAPVLTDPQTSTTGDPRGTYDPNTTLDGSKRIIAQVLANPFVNTSGNGGLHGIKHYYA